MSRIGLILLTLVGFAVVSRADEPKASDLDRLQGTWAIVSMEFSGNPANPEDIEGRVLVIKGEDFTDSRKDEVFAKGTLKLDPKAKPKTLDATFSEGALEGKTSLAIYELDGDTLKVCVSQDEGERPKALSTEPGSKTILVVYRRLGL